MVPLVAIWLSAVCLFVAPKQVAAEAPTVPDSLPQTYAVYPFENRSGLTSWNWMRTALAFTTSEKIEGIATLRPAYGEQIVALPGPNRQIDEAAVHSFAGETGAMWIWTGWVRRPDWKLQVGLSLWRISAAGASRVGEEVVQGDTKEVFKLLGELITRLSKKAKLATTGDRKKEIFRTPTSDFYAYTVFGRGLLAYRKARSAADLRQARRLLERAVLIDPAQAEAQQVLSMLHDRLGQESKARTHRGNAVSLRPNYASALLAEARSARKRQDMRSAQALYEKVLTSRPWDLETRFRLGQLLWDSGRPKVALRQLEMVTKHQPAHVRARRTLILIHASRGDEAGLIRELRAVSQLAPMDINTKLDLGAAYASGHRYEEAANTYREVVKIDPKNVQALKFLGDIYKKQGKLERSIRFYGQAMRAVPGDPRPYFLLGAAYVEAGDDVAAKRIYLKAQAFPEFRPEAYNNLGAIAYRQGKLKESLWYLERAVKQEPKRVRYRYNLALSQSALNETEAALANIDGALDMHPQHVELNYLRGVALLREGRAEEAREAFKRTLALDAGHSNARHNLAMLDALKRRATQGEVVIEGKR